MNDELTSEQIAEAEAAAAAQAEAEAAAAAGAQAPVATLGDPAESAVAVLEPAVSDQASHETKRARTKVWLDEQPKREVRIRKELGPQPVIINGHRYDVPAGVDVMVPEPVFRLLRDAELV